MFGYTVVLVFLFSSVQDMSSLGCILYIGMYVFVLSSSWLRVNITDKQLSQLHEQYITFCCIISFGSQSASMYLVLFYWRYVRFFSFFLLIDNPPTPTPTPTYPPSLQVVEEGCHVLYALFLWQLKPLFEHFKEMGSASALEGEFIRSVCIIRIIHTAVDYVWMYCCVYAHLFCRCTIYNDM